MTEELLYVIETKGDDDDPWRLDFNIPCELADHAFQNSIEQVFGFVFNDREDAQRIVSCLVMEYPKLQFRWRECQILVLPDVTRKLGPAQYGQRLPFGSC